MKRNEIKETKTIEEVVRVEFIAEDGEVFRSEEECKKYEESALFAISKQLKRMANKKWVSQYDIIDDCSEDAEVEIFNAENEKDIENIRRYVYLKAINKHPSTRRDDVDLPNITSGHEVMVFWNYEQDCCWAIGNGSIDAYCDYIRGNITRLITPEVKEEN